MLSVLEALLSGKRSSESSRWKQWHVVSTWFGWNTSSFTVVFLTFMFWVLVSRLVLLVHICAWYFRSVSRVFSNMVGTIYLTTMNCFRNILYSIAVEYSIYLVISYPLHREVFFFQCEGKMRSRLESCTLFYNTYQVFCSVPDYIV